MINRRNPHTRRNPTTRRVSDRRDGDRIPAESAVRFLRSVNREREVLHGVLHDVSAQGMGISFDEELKIGETLLIEVRGEGSRCFNATARVVRIVGTDSNEFGCEFCVEPSRHQIATLRELSIVDAAQ